MTTLTTLSVTGMTCEHCVKAVTSELSAIPDVNRVGVTLRKGGASAVTVHSVEALDEAALREAVAEAGYDVIEVTTRPDALTEASRGERGAVEARNAASRGGCCGGNCGCGGRGRRGQGIGLPIVPKD